MERYAMGRDEGVREDQVRLKMCQEHLMSTGELLAELIKEGEEEQSRGQRGLTRFLNCWRRAIEQETKGRSQRSDSDWSVVMGKAETPLTSPEQVSYPPVPASLKRRGC